MQPIKFLAPVAFALTFVFAAGSPVSAQTNGAGTAGQGSSNNQAVSTVGGAVATTSGQSVHPTENDWDTHGSIASARSHGTIPVADAAPASPAKGPQWPEGEMQNYRIGPFICLDCAPSKRGW